MDWVARMELDPSDIFHSYHKEWNKVETSGLHLRVSKLWLFSLVLLKIEYPNVLFNPNLKFSVPLSIFNLPVYRFQTCGLYHTGLIQIRQRSIESCFIIPTWSTYLVLLVIPVLKKLSPVGMNISQAVHIRCGPAIGISIIEFHNPVFHPYSLISICSWANNSDRTGDHN